MCGPGEAKRVVSCVRPEIGQDVEVDQSFCSKQIKPSDFVPCVVDVCPIGWQSKGEVKLKMTKICVSQCEACLNIVFLTRTSPCKSLVFCHALDKLLCMCGALLSASAQRPVAKVSVKIYSPSLRSSTSSSDKVNQSLMLM